jgi:hypothetical protein
MPHQIRGKVEPIKALGKGDSKILDVESKSVKELTLFHDELHGTRQDASAEKYIVQVNNHFFQTPTESCSDEMTGDDEVRRYNNHLDMVSKIKDADKTCSLREMLKGDRQSHEIDDTETSLRLYYQHKSLLMSDINTSKYWSQRNGYKNQYVYTFVQPNATNTSSEENNPSMFKQAAIQRKVKLPPNPADFDGNIEKVTWESDQKESMDPEGELSDDKEPRNHFVSVSSNDFCHDSFVTDDESTSLSSFSKEETKEIINHRFTMNSSTPDLNESNRVKESVFFVNLPSESSMFQKESIVSGKSNLFSNE